MRARDRTNKNKLRLISRLRKPKILSQSQDKGFHASTLTVGGGGGGGTHVGRANSPG